MSLEISLLGALISLFFILVLSGTLWWMLHPHAFVTQAAAKARQSVLAVKKIMVPTVGLPHTERSVELACRLGRKQMAEIYLIYILEVPRTMPLGVPLSDAEKEAEAALERATQIVLLHNLPMQKLIHRARVAGDDIAKLAKDMEMDMIVLGIQEEAGSHIDPLNKTANAILKIASCEVIIDKLPSS
ncbi:MAG: universal stress protein [Nitrospirae bacterium]|nr:universal stress protein [Candidatus Troglogloeales bacterium]MBI3598998.1 universal stress protein [Candidatus Troglogloeales bacterium]